MCSIWARAYTCGSVNFFISGIELFIFIHFLVLKFREIQGVKFLAGKYSCVKFLTNILSVLTEWQGSTREARRPPGPQVCESVQAAKEFIFNFAPFNETGRPGIYFWLISRLMLKLDFLSTRLFRPFWKLFEPFRTTVARLCCYL